MKKKFTPKQIKNGKMNYTFESFLSKLWKDVKSTLAKEYSIKISDNQSSNETNKKILGEVFAFVYKLCYLAAMNHPELKQMLKEADAENKNILQKTLKSNEENIALLRAIFMREISYRLEKGLTRRQAVKAAIEESENAFRKRNN